MKAIVTVIARQKMKSQIVNGLATLKVFHLMLRNYLKRRQVKRGCLEVMLTPFHLLMIRRVVMSEQNK